MWIWKSRKEDSKQWAGQKVRRRKRRKKKKKEKTRIET